MAKDKSGIEFSIAILHVKYLHISFSSKTAKKGNGKILILNYVNLKNLFGSLSRPGKYSGMRAVLFNIVMDRDCFLKADAEIFESRVADDDIKPSSITNDK